MSYSVYILWSASLSKYYVGCTQDLENRLKEHQSGEGNFTKKGIPWDLVWTNVLDSRSEALSLEQRIKKRGIKRFLENNSGGSSAR
ncbi:MAG: GIY-YIG nuclease family protein [Bacteroidetes bacterium]|nr:GIY-YIG nuclease family protein [Bacteroidota bacterium]